MASGGSTLLAPQFGSSRKIHLGLTKLAISGAANKTAAAIALVAAQKAADNPAVIIIKSHPR
jgi:hypothetical protein